MGDYFELADQPGRYKAAGPGAAPAGRPAHVLIIDDFLKGADEAMADTISEAVWQRYVQDLRPRLQKGSLNGFLAEALERGYSAKCNSTRGERPLAQFTPRNSASKQELPIALEWSR